MPCSLLHEMGGIPTYVSTIQLVLLCVSLDFPMGFVRTALKKKNAAYKFYETIFSQFNARKINTVQTFTLKKMYAKTSAPYLFFVGKTAKIIGRKICKRPFV